MEAESNKIKLENDELKKGLKEVNVEIDKRDRIIQ